MREKKVADDFLIDGRAQRLNEGQELIRRHRHCVEYTEIGR